MNTLAFVDYVKAQVPQDWNVEQGPFLPDYPGLNVSIQFRGRADAGEYTENLAWEITLQANDLDDEAQSELWTKQVDTILQAVPEQSIDNCWVVRLVSSTEFTRVGDEINTKDRPQLSGTYTYEVERSAA